MRTRIVNDTGYYWYMDVYTERRRDACQAARLQPMTYGTRYHAETLKRVAAFNARANRALMTAIGFASHLPPR